MKWDVKGLFEQKDRGYSGEGRIAMKKYPLRERNRLKKSLWQSMTSPMVWCTLFNGESALTTAIKRSPKRMHEPIVLPALDASFAAWLATQPVLECHIRQDLQMIWQCWRGRSHSEFVDGRDAAQRVRCVAERAGFVETASWYYQLYEVFCLRLITL